MIYLMIVNVSLIISFALYRLIFRKLTFFQWNRIYLIGMIIFSLLAPIGIFIELPKNEVIAYSIPMVDLSGYMDIAISSPKEQPIYLVDILTYVYWTGVAIACMLLLVRVIQLLRALRHKHDYLSFSFFNKIVIGGSITDKGSIASHERVHVEQGHSYDLLLMELLKIFNWFNPILYFFQKELKFQHECIADEVCSTDKVAYAEMLVAHALKVDHLALTHEFSNHSFLKKRIMMLFKNKSARKKRLLYAAVLPMLLVVMGSTLVFNTTRAKDIVSDVESSINQVELTTATEMMKVEDGLFTNNRELRSDTTKNRKVTDAKQAKLDAERAAAERQMKDGNTKLDSLDPAFNAIFTAVEVNPEPIGGMVNFMNWVATNYTYPKEALEKKANGIIEISFVVEKDGSLSDFKVKRDLGYGTKEAALELMKKARKWKPGIQNGQAVRVAYTLPIRLNLSDGKENQVVRENPAGSPVLGREGLEKWFIQNFKFPRKISKKDLDPVIQAYLTINVDGTIHSVLTNSDLGRAFAQEASRLLQKTKWNPAVVEGKPVKSTGFFRIKFTPDGGYVKNYRRVDVNSEPIGGMIAYRDYVIKNYNPNSTGEDGNVVVQFMVEKDGSLNDFKILNTPDTKAAQELVKLLQSGVKWKPGLLDGRQVRNQYELTLKVMKRNGNSYDVYRWEGLKVQKLKS
ncbi:energy transducer TonB [Sphingobacterium sp. NGMCC 1.201703]|uniref:energy transducer TonB n=1 Tax=Sphingobacterium sp. NGMCC 1.201703 TaxID=3388657 RepID=UPI0039FD7B67